MGIVLVVLVLSLVLIGCTIFLVSALGRIMAGIARHNMHMESIANSMKCVERDTEHQKNAISGLAQYYKRHEDQKRNSDVFAKYEKRVG